MDSHFMKEETNMANKYIKIYCLINNQGNANQDCNEEIFYIHSFGKIKKCDGIRYWRNQINKISSAVEDRSIKLVIAMWGSSFVFSYKAERFINFIIQQFSWI